MCHEIYLITFDLKGTYKISSRSFLTIDLIYHVNVYNIFKNLLTWILSIISDEQNIYAKR